MEIKVAHTSLWELEPQIAEGYSVLASITLMGWGGDAGQQRISSSFSANLFCFMTKVVTRKGLMQHKRKRQEGNTRFFFPACFMQSPKCFLTAPHVLKRNSSTCSQQGGLCRCRLAYGISDFLVTSGMLAEQQTSREKDILLITPCCPHPQAESYCFMQMSS